VTETPEGTLAPGCEHEIATLLERADAIGIGPGLGSVRATLEWVGDFLRRTGIPAVVDADAIGAIPPPPHTAVRVATPHSGELARWTGSEIASSLDRLEVAWRTAAKRGVTVLAKGAPTFVATPAGKLYVNRSGHAGLATAGSGDVLTGVVAAFLAAGCGASESAVLGAFVHGRAAELATRETSPRSLVAGDLLGSLGAALHDLELPGLPPSA
jgi:NAD(P)H-hydrate epimerase